jgi:hypothetical protein
MPQGTAIDLAVPGLKQLRHFVGAFQEFGGSGPPRRVKNPKAAILRALGTVRNNPAWQAPLKTGKGGF